MPVWAIHLAATEEVGPGAFCYSYVGHNVACVVVGIVDVNRGRKYSETTIDEENDEEGEDRERSKLDCGSNLFLLYQQR
jgi:hypothetical protein